MTEIMVNGKNYFNEESFDETCLFLEDGLKVYLTIDCIGHTRNNYEQENYRKALVNKYGRNLDIELVEGAYSYSYKYSLKEGKNNENN